MGQAGTSSSNKTSGYTKYLVFLALDGRKTITLLTSVALDIAT